ncbi:MAG: hypothetical protein PHH68_06825 [Candidatus Omnitrophica bacterium]|jgi:hypothetical protein|nr:hypothetical protein [Candidatus Omnitrophota bacterium]MDD5080016.1 hypothetical protein [Candidatus Omnitrophota bacterium]
MIYIISMTITLSFILSGVFLGLAPSIHRVIESDFLRRASSNAKIEGLQIGTLMSRSKPGVDQTRQFTSDLIFKESETIKKLVTTITIKSNLINVTIDTGE